MSNDLTREEQHKLESIEGALMALDTQALLGSQIEQRIRIACERNPELDHLLVPALQLINDQRVLTSKVREVLLAQDENVLKHRR